jgi:hypothetical protein
MSSHPCVCFGRLTGRHGSGGGAVWYHMAAENNVGNNLT